LVLPEYDGCLLRVAEIMRDWQDFAMRVTGSRQVTTPMNLSCATCRPMKALETDCKHYLEIHRQ
jgi:hypothetical protein